ncbi:unnamed protein product [Gongylonema pulchrum]|uniref:SCAPER_N domain-containing protein n=1 Tax=Gongylonema pulchrum TaxID=637853 RepID=A0A183EXJ2_9BILA|nr:unnamed protein product [Gongylonema pulchrum]
MTGPDVGSLSSSSNGAVKSNIYHQDQISYRPEQQWKDTVINYCMELSKRAITRTFPPPELFSPSTQNNDH